MKKMLVMLWGASFSITSVQANWWQDAAKALEQNQQKVVDVVTQPRAMETANKFSEGELQDAFRQALTMGSKTVVNNLSLEDSFNGDELIHIDLPDNLKKMQSLLSNYGMGSAMEELELKLNRAAEASAPEAKALFVNAIADMSFADVQTIYEGPKDSATRYLKSKTQGELKHKFTPIIDAKLDEVGALKLYDQIYGKYQSIPFVPDVKTDFTNHVLDGAISGMFHYIGEEEKDIRDNPVKHTTDVLKKVFGQ